MVFGVPIAEKDEPIPARSKANTNRALPPVRPRRPVNKYPNILSEREREREKAERAREVKTGSRNRGKPREIKIDFSYTPWHEHQNSWLVFAQEERSQALVPS